MTEPNKEHVTPHEERMPMPMSIRASLAMVVLAVACYITGAYLHGYEYGYVAFEDPVIVILAGVALAIGFYFFKSIYRDGDSVRQSVLIIAVIFIAMDLHSFFTDGLDYSLIAELIGTAAIWITLFCLYLPSSAAWREARHSTK